VGGGVIWFTGCYKWIVGAEKATGDCNSSSRQQLADKITQATE
jgi:hypothetical protein